jgi:sortase (surface protein transpeptidase)
MIDQLHPTIHQIISSADPQFNKQTAESIFNSTTPQQTRQNKKKQQQNTDRFSGWKKVNQSSHNSIKKTHVLLSCPKLQILFLILLF